MKRTSPEIRKFMLIALLLELVSTDLLADDRFLNGIVTHIRDGGTIEVEDIPIRLNGLLHLS